MDRNNEGRRTPYRLSLVVAFALLTAGLAGCHGEIKSQLSDQLVTFADKFFDVAHVKDDVFVLVGYEGRVLRSEDAGQSWQEIETPTKRTLNQIEFVDEYGWAVGHGGAIIHTRDGGKTWTTQKVDTDKTIFAVSFVDKLHGWASGDESMFLRTVNGGETWEVQRIEVSEVGLSDETRLAIPDIIYYGVDFVDTQHGWVVGEYGNIRHTSDGGQTWGDGQHSSLLDALVERGRSRDVMNLGAFFRVSFTDQNNGIIVGATGTVAMTDDGGQTWKWVAREGTKWQSKQGNTNDVPRLHLYDVARNGNDGQLVAAGANGIILTSANGGIDWKPAKVLSGVYTWVNGIAFANGSQKGVMVGGRGTILTTDDGGQTWRLSPRERASAKG